MSPPKRRSARLASSTIKSRPAPELPSVNEYDVTPSKTPSRRTPKAFGNTTTPTHAPKTPVSSALRPPHEEMHPSHVHTSMAAPSSALGLGFTDISSHREAGPQGTPSKIALPSSAFSFRVTKDGGDVQLSENAQRMMEEIREQASRIKADLVAQRLAEKSSAANDRKIAQPKGKSSRFSAAHMAEFKKMDSIEGHGSLWRLDKTTPLKAGIKRSPSKANLDATPTSTRSELRRSPSKSNLEATPTSTLKSALKRTSSRANLDEQVDRSSKIAKAPVSSVKVREGISSFAKRIKQRQDDDAATTRPAFQDDTSIPRPKSSGNGAALTKSPSVFGRLTSPSKLSLSQSVRKPTISLVNSPPKQPNFGELTRSATESNFGSPSKAAELHRRIISPGRFQKVKSILRGQSTATPGDKTAIPKPAPQVSQTPGPTRLEKELPPLPLTTPRRKLVKHVAFTPETRAAAPDQSPSPQKTALARSPEAAHYPTLDSVLADSKMDGVSYPDLSALKALAEKKALPKTVPGTFTFRSDHTIRFGDASASFGASPGQSSIRQVLAASAPREMPGTFPPIAATRSSHPNKENKAPLPPKLIPGAPHGMSNKKRHRASSDEDDADREAANRAAKKRKNDDVAEGEALLAPRLATSTPSKSVKKTPSGRLLGRTPGRTPSRTPQSASGTPSKKPMLSLSRLNMLARPKNRA